jgi:hypothetical protein
MRSSQRSSNASQEHLAQASQAEPSVAVVVWPMRPTFRTVAAASLSPLGVLGVSPDSNPVLRSLSRIGTAVPPAQHRAYGDEHDAEQNTGHSAVTVLGGHACEVAWDKRWQRTCGDHEVDDACNYGHNPQDENHHSDRPANSHP